MPRENAEGERRVALVPDTAGRLVSAGFDVAVERGAGTAAGSARRGVHRGRRGRCRARRPARWRRGRPPRAVAERGRDRSARGRHRADRLPLPAHRRGRHRAARPPRRGRVRDGVDPAHHARTVDGRAVVAEHRRGLQGGTARRRPAAEALPAADDRRRHGRPGEGARPRRRRGRPAGDRDRAAPGRGRVGVRRAARGEGAGREPRRDVPRPRSPRRGDGGRLRAGALLRRAGPPAGGARGADRRSSTR